MATLAQPPQAPDAPELSERLFESVVSAEIDVALKRIDLPGSIECLAR